MNTTLMRADEARTLTALYPRYFIWENVPGAFTSGSERGADFRAVLESIAETDIPMPKDGRWATAGMVQCPKCEIAWRVLDAQYWGVPQRRKRIFLVADFAATDRRAGKILFIEPSLSGNTEQSRETRKRVASTIEKSIRTASEDVNLEHQNAQDVIRENKQAPTLNARMGTGGNQVPILLSAGFKGKQSASARGIGYKEEQCPTLTAAIPLDVMTMNGVQDAVRRLMPLECERLQGLPDGWTLINDKSCSDSARYKAIGNGMAQPCADYVIQRIVDEVMRPVTGDKSNCLNSRMGTGGNNIPLIIDKPVFCVGNGQLAQLRKQDTVGALNCMHDQQIVAICQRDGEAIAVDYRLRRLTPLECERLQGIPDNWTLIDDKTCSDSARYKAIGNGMAQPCADFVMKRVYEFLQRKK